MAHFIQPRAIFPGRVTLYLREVARFLSVTEPDVLDLISAGKLRATTIHEVAEMRRRPSVPNRKELRVPVEALEEYLKAKREEECQA